METQERPEFVVETERIYKTFSKEIDIIRESSPSKKTDIRLDEIVIAAYTKAYDFILFLCSLKNYSSAFFFLPMLRSICEDLIAITYIMGLDVDEQKYLIVTRRNKEITDSSKAQSDFFKKYNEGQIILPIINEGQEEEVLKFFREAGHILKEVKFPTVKQMATATGMIDLYNFMYHATSKAVHFDMMTLLSMGWGTIDKENKTLNANFSYTHFHKHYYIFSLFYSNYLFIEQSKRFETFLALPPEIMNNLKKIEEDNEDVDWPELITFEQMNIKGPSSFERMLHRFLTKHEKSV